MKQLRYKNIFLFASPQFSGNIVEYFTAHTEKLVIYLTMPRFNNRYNIVQLYRKGKLVSEKKVISSGNVFLYYFLWFVTYLWCLFTLYKKDEEVFVITWQPFFFFGQTLQRLFRNVHFVYWIGDYFPPVSLSMRIYEKIKKYYAKQLPYVCYLSDRINSKMNGKILSTNNKKTVMWGIKPVAIPSKEKKIFTLCFIGVIKPSQGLETLLEIVKKMKDIRLKILGASTEEMAAFYKKIIADNGIEQRVYFPNKMFYGKEIEKEVKDCFLGVALYDVDKNSATYYADPGKIKTYTQYGLPVLMTPIADIEKYVKKYTAGEIVVQNIADVERAIKKIKKDYKKYITGVESFNDYFNYETYYKRNFSFLE